MPLPTSKAALEVAGYWFDCDAICKGCGEPIEFWGTPKGKKMPMSVKAIRATDSPISPILEYVRVSHWGECENARDFKAKK